MSHDKEKIRKFILNQMLKSLLTYLPILIGCGVMFLPKLPNRVTFSLAAFIGGFSGVIIIIRKEAPSSFVSIRGVPAVILGIIGTVLLWICAIIVLLSP